MFVWLSAEFVALHRHCALLSEAQIAALQIPRDHGKLLG